MGLENRYGANHVVESVFIVGFRNVRGKPWFDDRIPDNRDL